jgi:hypothetical protein
MHPWHPRVVSAEETPQAGEWPVRLWQRLLVESRVPMGGRVLVIGCRQPEVVEILSECSFDVAGIDDDPVQVDAANRLFPRYSFSFCRLDEPLAAMNCACDLLLVHEVEAYRRDLLDISVRLMTANLLACLKPRGQLVVIRRLAGDRDVSAGHHPDCWAKHLACFPGTTVRDQFADPWFSRSTWNWLRGQSPRGSHLVVRHEVPLELYPRDAWVRCARRGQIPDRAACCPAAASSTQPQTQRRAA